MSHVRTTDLSLLAIGPLYIEWDTTRRVAVTHMLTAADIDRVTPKANACMEINRHD